MIQVMLGVILGSVLSLSAAHPSLDELQSSEHPYVDVLPLNPLVIPLPLPIVKTAGVVQNVGSLSPKTASAFDSKNHPSSVATGSPDGEPFKEGVIKVYNAGQEVYYAIRSPAERPTSGTSQGKNDFTIPSIFHALSSLPSNSRRSETKPHSLGFLGSASLLIAAVPDREPYPSVNAAAQSQSNIQPAALNFLKNLPHHFEETLVVLAKPAFNIGSPQIPAQNVPSISGNPAHTPKVHDSSPLPSVSPYLFPVISSGLNQVSNDLVKPPSQVISENVLENSGNKHPAYPNNPYIGHLRDEGNQKVNASEPASIVPYFSIGQKFVEPIIALQSPMSYAILRPAEDTTAVIGATPASNNVTVKPIIPSQGVQDNVVPNVSVLSNSGIGGDDLAINGNTANDESSTRPLVSSKLPSYPNNPYIGHLYAPLNTTVDKIKTIEKTSQGSNMIPNSIDDSQKLMPSVSSTNDMQVDLLNRLKSPSEIVSLSPLKNSSSNSKYRDNPYIGHLFSVSSSSEKSSVAYNSASKIPPSVGGPFPSLQAAHSGLEQKVPSTEGINFSVASNPHANIAAYYQLLPNTPNVGGSDPSVPISSTLSNNVQPHLEGGVSSVDASSVQDIKPDRVGVLEAVQSSNGQRFEDKNVASPVMEVNPPLGYLSFPDDSFKQDLSGAPDLKEPRAEEDEQFMDTYIAPKDPVFLEIPEVPPLPLGESHPSGTSSLTQSASNT